MPRTGSLASAHSSLSCLRLAKGSSP
jgi:hypothetical protein